MLVRLLAALLLLAAAPAPGRACSPPWGIWVVDVMPPDGASDVPVNAQIALHYSVADGQDANDIGPPELRTADGALVSVETECWYPNWRTIYCRLVPTAELAANATFEIHDRVASPCADSACVSETSQARASFTTGRVRDDEPPEFDGVESVAQRFDESSDSCGAYSEVTFTLSWEPADDDSDPSWVRYDVVRGDFVFFHGHPWPRIAGSVLCDGRGDFWPYTDFAGSPGAYSVIAVDVAGNVTAPDREVIVRSCEAVAAGEGCGCRATRGSSSAWLMLLVLLGLRRLRSR